MSRVTSSGLRPAPVAQSTLLRKRRISAERPHRLRNGPHRVHHALDDGRLPHRTHLEGRSKAVVKRTLERRKPIENRRGTDLRGTAAEAPAQLIHPTRGRQRGLLRRLVVGARLSAPVLVDRTLVRRNFCSLVRWCLVRWRLQAAGMIFAHRRKPAPDTLVIGRLHGPGCPGARIFLPNGFRRRQAL
jgi:hypothetical protein